MTPRSTSAFLSTRCATLLLLGLLPSLWSIVPVCAATLIGGDIAGVLYDINAANGAASNPRPTGLYQMAGFTVTPDGLQAYALTTFGHAQPNALFRIELATDPKSVV